MPARKGSGYPRLRSTIHFWKGTRKELALAALSALVAYLAIRLWLKRVPEKFPGGAVFGDLVLAISLSVIAAFIFYLVNVQLKDHRSKQRMNAYIGPQLKRIVLISAGFVHSINPKRQLEPGLPSSYTVPTLLGLLRHFSTPDDDPRSRKLLMNYVGRQADLRATIQDVLTYHAFLDLKLIEILNGMKKSYLFSRLDDYDTSEALTSLAEPVYELMLHLRDLHSYCAAHMPDYLEDREHKDFEMFELYQRSRARLRSLRRHRSNRKRP
ncbi:MAG: hypothetical protein WAU70_07140 [Flavobacteriales bacterium]